MRSPYNFYENSGDDVFLFSVICNKNALFSAKNKVLKSGLWKIYLF